MERTRRKDSSSGRCSIVVEIGQHKLMRSGNAGSCSMAGLILAQVGPRQPRYQYFWFCGYSPAQCIVPS